MLEIKRLQGSINDLIGVMASASARSESPTETETLVLRTAVNQAATALHAVKRTLEQERVTVELERRVASRTAELRAANRQLTMLKDELAAELLAMTRLHEFTTRLWAIAELPALLEEALTATIEIQQADFGDVRLRNPQSRALEIVAHRGFGAECLEYFASVDDTSTGCGRAMQSGSRVVIEDVQTDPLFASHTHIAAAAGFRAVQSTPLFSRAGELLGVISTHFKRPHRPSARDLRLTDLYARQAAEIIERKRADDERAKLMALIDQLTHVTRIMSIGELTTSIAHEINQPLGGVVANGNACIRWLDREAPNLKEARACAEHVVRDAGRVTDVIRGIRAFTRKAPALKQALDVNAIIHEVVSMLSEQLRGCRVETTLVLTDGAVSVLADHIQLQQVFVNLVINAVEALIPITDRPRRMRICSRRDIDDLVTVCVEDEGVGLEEEVLKRLFDAFFTTKPTGMGLGLSISRNIIQAHGGELKAARNHPHGLTMTFSLPAHDRMS